MNGMEPETQAQQMRHKEDAEQTQAEAMREATSHMIEVPDQCKPIPAPFPCAYGDIIHEIAREVREITRWIKGNGSKGLEKRVNDLETEETIKQRIEDRNYDMKQRVIGGIIVGVFMMVTGGLGSLAVWGIGHRAGEGDKVATPAQIQQAVDLAVARASVAFEQEMLRLHSLPTPTPGGAK